jgi:hypothetical protein
MPLVRISFMKGRPADFGERAGTIVYESMVETIDVPRNDRFQVITEHDEHGLIYDPGYLGIQRGDGIMVIQITLSEGRSAERKKISLQTHRRSPERRARSSDRGRVHQPGRSEEGELVLRQRRCAVRHSMRDAP